MPNSLQSSAIASPASRRATNRSLSSITEHSFQGITPSPLRGESVTYVSGTMCYLCLRPLINKFEHAFFLRLLKLPGLLFPPNPFTGQNLYTSLPLDRKSTRLNSSHM